MNDDPLSELCIGALHRGVKEIRELQELNAELLAALKALRDHTQDWYIKSEQAIVKAEAAK